MMEYWKEKGSRRKEKGERGEGNNRIYKIALSEVIHESVVVESA